jgi:hypothetical protein
MNKRALIATLVVVIIIIFIIMFFSKPSKSGSKKCDKNVDCEYDKYSVQSAFRECKSGVLASECTVTCKDGYTNKKLVNNVYRCELPPGCNKNVDCEYDNNSVQSAFRECKSGVLASDCTVTCKDGYTNAKLINNIYQCELVPQPPTPTPTPQCNKNADCEYDKNSVQSAFRECKGGVLASDCTVTCKDGYTNAKIVNNIFQCELPPPTPTPTPTPPSPYNGTYNLQAKYSAYAPSQIIVDIKPDNTGTVSFVGQGIFGAVAAPCTSTSCVDTKQGIIYTTIIQVIGVPSIGSIYLSLGPYKNGYILAYPNVGYYTKI